MWNHSDDGSDRCRPGATGTTAKGKNKQAMTAPYAKNSETSREAAESLPEPALARLEATVLRSISASGDFGRTDDELERITMLTHQTVSARRRGLVQKGRVVDSGTQRATRSGRKATVWIVGSGVVEQGTTLDRAARPTNETLRWGAQEIRALMQGRLFARELEAIARWLEHISRT
jgi:hypothetical protein